MHAQEVRRQAMLQVMQVAVWLPRQQLVNAADSRDYLLDWQSWDESTEVAAEPAAKLPPAAPPASPAAISMEVVDPVTAPRTDAWVSVRDKMALTPISASAKANVSAVVEDLSADAVLTSPVVAAPPAEPIPRFALQLLRADNCLLLVDLPTGEAFQSRDPDYQLLKDMLRAAGLTDQPDFMRQSVPIAWPMLHSGNLMHEQHAAAARACVRDLLSFELQSAPAVCIWLLGKHAVRFASATDETALYELQPFVEGAQLWALPSLESVLEQPLLKRDIWRSMCALRSLWQLEHE